jgi:hypothetical protein
VPQTLNIFQDDAFGLVSLTQEINNVDHVPGRAGEMAFANTGSGVATDMVMIDMQDTTLSLIQTSERGAPAEQESVAKRRAKAVAIPQVKLEQTFQASQFRNVRALGSTSEIEGPRSVISAQMAKLGARHDLTLENLRLGALRGRVLDADGTLLLNLYTLFGISEPTAVNFSDVLTGETTELPLVRTKCHELQRTMQRTAKIAWPGAAKVWAFCGDNFFDRLVESSSVRATVAATDAARAVLGDSYVNGVIYFGGVYWENYRGTDDNSTVAIDTDDAQFFPVGIPGLYSEYYAPADFIEAVDTIGLPRYAKTAVDQEFGRWVKLHTQQNPLSLCNRPQVLIRGTVASE